MKFDERMLQAPPKYSVYEMCERLKRLHGLVNGLLWVSMTGLVTADDILRVLIEQGNVNPNNPPGLAPVKIHADGVTHMPADSAVMYLNWWFDKLYYHTFNNEVDRLAEWYNATRYVLGDWKP